MFLFAKQQRYWFDLDPIREDRVVPDAKRTGTQKLRSVQNQSRNASNAESFWNTGIYKSSGRNPGDVWTIPTQPFPQAHFATYPMALPQRAILAGCTPRRCAQCGQKPTPIIDGASDYAERDTSKRNQKWAEVGGGHGDVGRGRNNNLGNYRKTTIGYTDCGHNAYRPGIVLDPFHGSGTTGQAAQHTGRRYIGIDINAEYLDLSLNTRLRNATLDFGTA